MTWNGTGAVFTGSTGTDYDALGGVAVVFEEAVPCQSPQRGRCSASGFAGIGFAGYRKTQSAAHFAALIVTTFDVERPPRGGLSLVCAYMTRRARKRDFRAGSISQFFTRIGGFDLFAAPSPKDSTLAH